MFADSLGGIYAREVAMAYPDSVNCVITYDSPHLGIENISDSDLNAFRAASFIRLSGTIEQITPYLLAIGKDKNYKDGVIKQVKDFTGNGRIFATFANSGDSIVPKETAFIPGSTQTVNGKPFEGVRNIPRSGTDELSRARDHGAIVQDRETRYVSLDLVGPNLFAN